MTDLIERARMEWCEEQPMWDDRDNPIYGYESCPPAVVASLLDAYEELAGQSTCDTNRPDIWCSAHSQKRCRHDAIVGAVEIAIKEALK